MSSSSNLDRLKALTILDKIITLKKCPHCRQPLKKPFVLPCGHTVCKMHIFKRGWPGFNTKTITCKVCEERHEGDYTKIKNNFATDLVSKVNSYSMDSLYNFVLFFDVNKYDKNSQDSKIVFEKLSTICHDLKNDPYSIVFNKINEIIKPVQLQKVNKLKKSMENQNEEINSAAEKEEKFIDELSTYRNECRGHLNTLEFKEKHDKLIDSVESQIKTFLRFWDLFKSTDDMTSINVANNKYFEIINSKIESFIKNELFLNKFNYFKDEFDNFIEINLD